MPGWEQTVREIRRRLYASKTAAEAAVLLVEHLAPALKAQGALVQLWQPHQAAPFLSRAWGRGQEYQEPGRLPLEHLPAPGQGQTVVVLPGAAGHGGGPVGEDGSGNLAALVLLPLGGEEDWQGHLIFFYDQPREFDPMLLDLLEDIGQQATCALSKIQLIARQQEEFDRLAQQTERLTALGRLAAGVAHELNNPLASILLYSSNLLKKVPAGPLHEGLATIIHETKRCKNLIQEFLELARSQEPKKIVSNLNAILAKVSRLLENEFRRRAVRLQQSLATDLPDLWIDLGQMQQVFVHLLLNALEAVPAKGEVEISSRWDRDRQAVVIAITDNGSGIPPEHLDRIFEPFFSTKPRGIGLGLSVSRDFVQNHQGQIHVESRPGQGTRVTVIIPTGAVPLRGA
jgi:two-component system NtrC family sensor kinase